LALVASQIRPRGIDISDAITRALRALEHGEAA
jgi:hypothetical protein